MNDMDTNSSIPFALSDIDPLDSCNILKNIPITNINNNTHQKNNSSVIEYSLMSDNNLLNGNNTERINRTNIFEKKNIRKRRNLSYGNLQVRMNKNCENFKIDDNNKNITVLDLF